MQSIGTVRQFKGFTIIEMEPPKRRTYERAEWQPDPFYLQMEQLVDSGKLSSNAVFGIPGRATKEQIIESFNEILAVSNPKELTNDQLFLLALSNLSLEDLNPYQENVMVNGQQVIVTKGHLTLDFLAKKFTSSQFNIYGYGRAYKSFQSAGEAPQAKKYRFHIYLSFRSHYAFTSEQRNSLSIFNTLRRFGRKKSKRYGDHRMLRLICAWGSEALLEALQSIFHPGKTYWTALQEQSRAIGLAN